MGLGRQSERQRTAPQQHLPPLERGLSGLLAVEDHLQDGRHTVGETHPLVAVEPHQLVWLVTPRIDLLHPQHGRHIGDAPGMDVEHGGDGHVDIV